MIFCYLIYEHEIYTFVLSAAFKSSLLFFLTTAMFVRLQLPQL